MMYVYAAIAIAFAGMGVEIKYQHSVIVEKEATISTLETKNKSLSDKIVVQNDALRKAETDFNNAQAALNAADAKNVSLTADFNTLRDSWSKVPVPKDCPSAIKELKTRTATLAQKWNKK